MHTVDPVRLTKFKNFVSLLTAQYDSQSHY